MREIAFGLLWFSAFSVHQHRSQRCYDKCSYCSLETSLPNYFRFKWFCPLLVLVVIVFSLCPILLHQLAFRAAVLPLAGNVLLQQVDDANTTTGLNLMVYLDFGVVLQECIYFRDPENTFIPICLDLSGNALF